MLCDHTNSLLSNCHWLFCLWPLPDNSLGNQTEKVVLYTGTVNNLCRVEEMREKWRRTRVGLDNEPGDLSDALPRYLLSFTNTTHLQRPGESCYSFLDVPGSSSCRLLSRSFSYSLCPIRRSYWSLTILLGSWFHIYLFPFYFFKKNNSLSFHRYLYVYPFNAFIIVEYKEEENKKFFSFHISFQFFSLGALLWSGTPSSAPSRYHLSTLFWNQYII